MAGKLVRGAIIGFGMLAAFEAEAADVLRGSITYVPGTPTYHRWDGFYGGVQAGYAVGTADFEGATTSLVGHILRESVLAGPVSSWQTLGHATVTDESFGGFVGYNTQWDDVVLGLEVNYNRTSLSKTMSDSLARRLNIDTAAPPGHHFFYDTTVDGSASLKLTDFATFRARAGWTVGNALPYVFGGVAVGRAEVVKTATVSSYRTDVPDVADPPTTPLPDLPFGPVTQTDSRKNAFVYGYAVGLGIDYALMQNLFVRAEWELLDFPNIQGLELRINSARIGAGLKF